MVFEAGIAGGRLPWQGMSLPPCRDYEEHHRAEREHSVAHQDNRPIAAHHGGVQERVPRIRQRGPAGQPQAVPAVPSLSS